MELPAVTDGCTGADVAYACQRAATICVKAAAGKPDDVEIAITEDHLRTAVAAVIPAATPMTLTVRRARTAG